MTAVAFDIASLESRTAEILARLVAFDTTSHKSNIPLVDYVRDYLAGHGIASDLIPTEDGEKASLVATIGPANAGGVGLSGHTDVVPARAEDWSSDPFRLDVRDGRYWGRGTADMKGFVACVLAMAPEYQRLDLREPIHILLSYDEEIGCIGVRPMIAEMGLRLPRPRIVIVGEPTGMAVVDAHKGPVRWSADFTGRAAHSSMAHIGVNAITFAGEFLAELQRIENELRTRYPDPRFDPPYPTLQVTRIDGGTASNIIPVTCRVGFEVRATRALDIDTLDAKFRAFAEHVLLPRMRAIAPEAAIDIARQNSVPAFQSEAGSEAVALALALTRQNETFGVSYATEAGLFQDAGAATVVCGPGHIAQAHTADEWIDEAEIRKCLAFLARLGDWAAR
ncbi:MAG: acetylornithine deacetylase [Hyphomicrobium sp.]|nr:acetylornithine deacetylase [Hyphomicrobium sp.]